MMSRARSSRVVGLAVLLLGCQPQWSGFSEPQIDAALAAAENVRPETIAGQVREIYQVRLGDAEPDFAFEELCPEAGCA
jgi:hypothetical protein